MSIQDMPHAPVAPPPQVNVAIIGAGPGGIGVDCFTYQYSFAKNPGWSRLFPRASGRGPRRGVGLSNSPVVYRHRTVKGRNGSDLAAFYDTRDATAVEISGSANERFHRFVSERGAQP
jgi:hypothetical protein